MRGGRRRHRARVDEEGLPGRGQLVGQLADPGDDRRGWDACACEAHARLGNRERAQAAIRRVSKLEDALVIGVDELWNPVAGECGLKRQDSDVDADVVEEAQPRLQVVRLEPGFECPFSEDELLAVDAWRTGPLAQRCDQLVGPQVLVDVKGGHLRARIPARGGQGRR